jgi:cephalosporin-C deacetylase
MPLIDLPLEELLTYKGRNPRPADFDAFWSKALGDLDAVDPKVELKPIESPARFADCFEMRWNGVGGARVFAKLVRPKSQPKPGPALLRFHGYSVHSGDWFDSLAFAANGFTVASLDVRGQGGKSEDPGGVQGNTLRGHIIRGLSDSAENLFFRNVFLDTAQLARLVMEMPEVDATRVGATGWSQGGALTLVCASLEPRIARLAPVYPFLCDYQRVWEMDLAKGAYEELQTWFRHFDPRHERESEIFERLGYVDVQHFTNRIKGTTMMITGLMDPTCPPSSQFAAFNKIAAPKEVKIYPDFSHEGLPQAHDLIYDFMAELI